MTVSSSTARIRHSGNGATVSFSTSFAFLANSHVRVIHTSATGTDTDWVENTQYTLSGADTGAAGTVVVKTSPTDYTPATGEYLTIIRNVPFTQTLDGSILDTMSAGDLEDSLDKIWHGLGQVNEKLSRAIVGSETGDGTATSSISTWIPEFAVATDGARRVLEVVSWSGGEGTEPDLGYVGASGIVAAIGDGVDIRGAQGAAGAGTGDMLAANNLSDVVAATARTNLGLETGATTVVGTAATKDVGTAAGNVVMLDGSAKLPAVDGSQLTNVGSIPSGTLMLFQQTAAPTGWTKQTTHNDKALRVVSGAASSGGSTDFSTVFAQTVTGAHTLTSGEQASMTVTGTSATLGANAAAAAAPFQSAVGTSTAPEANIAGTISGTATGGGGSHTHTISLVVKYVDLIIAAKD